MKMGKKKFSINAFWIKIFDTAFFLFLTGLLLYAVGLIGYNIYYLQSIRLIAQGIILIILVGIGYRFWKKNKNI
jgi:hypothetical protein